MWLTNYSQLTNSAASKNTDTDTSILSPQWQITVRSLSVWRLTTLQDNLNILAHTYSLVYILYFLECEWTTTASSTLHLEGVGRRVQNTMIVFQLPTSSLPYQFYGKLYPNYRFTSKVVIKWQCFHITATCLMFYFVLCLSSMLFCCELRFECSLSTNWKHGRHCILFDPPPPPPEIN